MRRRTRVGAGLALAVAGLWGLSGSVLAADTPVTIQGFAFGPASVTVQVGDSVTWSNEDTTAHTATAGDGTFDTGSIAAGSTGSATFDTAGTYAYACSIHPAMTGTVVVEAASSGGSDGGGNGGGSGGGAATPPSTDTAAPDGDETTTDASGFVAALLAVLGVAMVVGTVLFDRRAAAERVRR